MQPYPSSPESDPVPQGSSPAPASVKTAVKLIWANVALSILSTVVTFASLDSIIDTGMQGTSGGDRDSIRLTVIVSAVIGLIIGVALAALFAYFIAKGANWARIVYTVLLGLGIVFGLFGLFGSQPVLLLVLSVLSLAISVAILYFLYRPESSRYFKGQQA